MPKKRSPILEKVSSFMKISIKLAKLRKPITLNLIFFKKSSNRVKLLRHYNYGYIQEYQFSPCNTPLIVRRFDNNNGETKRRDLYSMLLMCMCLGGFTRQAMDEEAYCRNPSIEFVLPAIESAAFNSFEEQQQEHQQQEEEEIEMMADSSECDTRCSSVDERAERFIEKFYEQMRMQRTECSSLLLGD